MILKGTLAWVGLLVALFHTMFCKRFCVRFTLVSIKNNLPSKNPDIFPHGLE